MRLWSYFDTLELYNNRCVLGKFFFGFFALLFCARRALASGAAPASPAASGEKGSTAPAQQPAAGAKTPEEEARALGINTALLRLIVVVCSTLITAAAVSVSGLIGWVGLVIPHRCRRYIGNDYRKLLPASMLFGAAFLLLVDNISRNLLAVEIPIGILTAFIGAPFFIYLMRQKGGGV
mgnify:CR=1 FL=1